MNNKQRRQKAATGFYSIKRLRQHLFRSNCFTVWPDKIAAINRTSIGFFTWLGPLSIIVCACHDPRIAGRFLLFVLYAVIYAIYGLQIQKHMNERTTLFAYLIQLPAVLAGLFMSTFLNMAGNGFSILIMLAVFPFFIFDKPWRLTGYLLAIAAAFLGLAFFLKPFPLFLHECLHTAISLLIGWAGQMFILNSRIDSVEQGEYDPLTHLYNRRGAENRIRALVNGHHPGTMLMIDVDHFKQVNDAYGHKFGDQTLVSIGQALHVFFTDHNVVMRYGGDEFIVFIDGVTSRAEVEAKLTDLKQKIHQLRVLPDEQELSISVGAAIYDGLAHTSYEDLGGLADRQLYKAKCNGRDGFAIE